MSKGTFQGAKLLFGWKPPTRFDKYPGNLLPPAYIKFFNECKETPKPVHYIPTEGKYKLTLSGRVLPIQNVPINTYPVREMHRGIWGGESVIKGFQKRGPKKRRIPHFWVPALNKTVVHSVILNRYMSVNATNRTIDLIHEHHGFDNYLLETKACDLNSLLASRIKRDILKAIQAGCPDLAHDPEKQKEILEKYKDYTDRYTPEELEWYGLSFNAAVEKAKRLKEKEERSLIKPMKHLFRKTLLDQLKDVGVNEVEHITETMEANKSWISSINPFKK